MSEWQVIHGDCLDMLPTIAERIDAVIMDPPYGISHSSNHGGPGWEGSRDEGVLRGHLCVSWESQGRAHPHQKPRSLMLALLKKLPSATNILDPFCGTAPVGEACQLLGMNYIGIELDADYAAIARRRISEAAPLFAEAAP